jgi:hypothetical protein
MLVGAHHDTRASQTCGKLTALTITCIPNVGAISLFSIPKTKKISFFSELLNLLAGSVKAVTELVLR